MNKPIGIIDSGIGGLSIAQVVIENLPKESIVYIADSKNCPYGEKPLEEIYNLTKKMVTFLLKKDIKLLIVACNTITVSTIEKLRKDYPQIPIVGIVPVIKKAAEKTKNKKIGIYSTFVTANSKYQKDLIEKHANNNQVINAGSSELVSLIEKFNLKEIDKVLNQELEVFKNAGIDTLALGCSHFPLVKTRIQKQLPGVLILDSAKAVTRQVGKILKNNRILSNSLKPSYNFYTTGEPKVMKYFINKLTSKGKIERISPPANA